MGSHLRFGFEATYGRDTVNMRNDNVADYPWLCYALATLMKAEHARMHAAGEDGPARRQVVESPLNGLSADARAMIGRPPPRCRARKPSAPALPRHFTNAWPTSCTSSRRSGRPGRLLFAVVLLLQLLPQRLEGRRHRRAAGGPADASATANDC